MMYGPRAGLLRVLIARERYYITQVQSLTFDPRTVVRANRAVPYNGNDTANRARGVDRKRLLLCALLKQSLSTLLYAYGRDECAR